MLVLQLAAAVALAFLMEIGDWKNILYYGDGIGSRYISISEIFFYGIC